MSDEQLLQGIGLSPAATACYLCLVEHVPKGLTAAEIVAQTDMPRASVYRALKELTTKGFAHAHRAYRYTIYRAEMLWQALDNYSDYQRTLVKPIMRVQRDRYPDA